MCVCVCVCVCTKLLVAGVNCEDTDLQPIYIRGGAIEAMTEFKYLGTIIEANGSIQREVEDRISKASRVFGALKGPVFSDSDLSLATKVSDSATWAGSHTLVSGDVLSPPK